MNVKLTYEGGRPALYNADTGDLINGVERVEVDANFEGIDVKIHLCDYGLHEVLAEAKLDEDMLKQIRENLNQFGWDIVELK